MTNDEKENRIDEIRRQLVADESRPHGDERAVLVAELEKLELELQD